MNQKKSSGNSEVKSQRVWRNGFLFGCLLFSYPILSFFWRHSYPVFAIESLGFFAAVFILSALLVIVIQYAHKIVSTLLVAGMVAITFALQFNMGLTEMVIVAVVVTLLHLLLDQKFFKCCLPVLAMLIVGALFDSRDSSDRIDQLAKTQSDHNGLPPIVHIILDGFIGMGGLPDYPSSALIKNEVEGFFTQYEFQLFPRAYSRYITTVDSLYSAFKFKDDKVSRYSLEIEAGENHVMKQNSVFDALQKLGYRFNIYQTDHLDFCQSHRDALDRCWNYGQPNVDSIRYAKSIPMRIQMLAKVMLGQFDLFNSISKRRFSPQHVAIHNPNVFSNLQGDLVSRPDGNVFFAHVLLPHSPYTYLNDCSVSYGFDPMITRAGYVFEPIREEAIYETRWGLYFEQVECALNSMRKLFDEMKNVGILGRSIIVVHGDHGSMIGKYLAIFRLRDQILARDYLSDYSTLFAVKLPGGQTDHDDRILPLSFLLKEYINTVEALISGDGTNQAFMQTLEGDPEELTPHVYLSSSVPLMRVDINIFDNNRP